MTDCPRCGTANAEGSRFCNNCGASLVARVGVQERRVVTALFADLARSTSMGERLDPEVTRRLVGDFFELATREIEARGGTVEKFSGDAVMAVFGLPQAHEDDPERAVRAALAIRDGLADAAAGAQERHGIKLQARIGIESGEVVVGDPFGGATMATGDAMNLAARLEQQAEPGDVLVGEQAWDAVRDLVDAEPLGELSLRGHEAPLKGWRVSAVASEVGRPRGVPGLQAPLTGRDEELALLLDAARRAKQERKAVLFTILGVPGVGKSRLVREASARLLDEGWSIVRGRCLPYGDGITYWPVAEMVRSMVGDESGAGRGDGADQLLMALGLVGGKSDSANESGQAGQSGQSDESGESADKKIAYAFRQLVESVGGRQPVMLIFEDIHWAEPPLLDLIEYLATWTRDAPVLICCPSRPELIDTRPGWGSGRMEASRISLEPLTEDESRALLGALLAVEDLPAELRQRVLDRAEGNPLFVEEVVRMLIEEGVVERRGDHWFATGEAANVRVPDSVEALIRARLDTLPSAERVVLQAASVVGRVFQRSAVASLAPVDQVPPPLEEHLEDAVLRDLITDERIPDEPTFRFRHILIRDVAYATLPKARRAEFHRGVAEWLRAWAGPRIEEFAEIEAYHLEQAVLIQRELGGVVDEDELDKAVDRLAASAQKAASRDDRRAVRTFVERAMALDPSAIDERLDLKWIYIAALGPLGEYTRAGQLASELEQAAHAAGRRDIEGRAIWVKAGGTWVSPDSADAPAALIELERARRLLEDAADWVYLVRVLEFIGYGGWWHGEFDGAVAGWTQMAEVARAHNLPGQEAEALTNLSKVYGLRGDNEERLRLLERARELAESSGNRLVQARVERVLGFAVALLRSAQEGQELLESAAQVLDELGDTDELAMAVMMLGDLDFRAGNGDAALQRYRESLAMVMDHVGYRPELKRRIATALLETGRLDEAAPVAEEARQETAKDDWATVAITATVLGNVRFAQGRTSEAEELLRSGVEVIDRTEFPGIDEYLSLANFLARTGRPDEAREWLAKTYELVRAYPPDSPWAEAVIRRATEIEAEAAAEPTEPARLEADRELHGSLRIMTSMQRRLAEAVKEMTTSVLGENGRAPLALRVAALRGESVPAEIEPYVAKVRDTSYRVTDDDFAALRRAGLSEDEIFDITVAAAIGSAADSVEPALAILSRS